MNPPSDQAGPQVCHLSTVHRADDTRVFWRECSGLAERGFRVTLIARADRDQVRNRVRIVALPTYRRRPVRMTMGVLRALIAAFRAKADVYHAHDPELIPALLVLRLAGRKVVYDAHELLSGQVASKDYLPSTGRRLVAASTRGLERLVGRLASRIVTVSEACAAVFPAEKVSIVANYPELPNFRPAPMSPEPVSPMAFGYVGGITANRGIEQLVDAMEVVNRTHPSVLVLVGQFESEGLRARMADRPGWAHVEFVGTVPHDQVASTMSRCRAGIATFLPTPNNVIGSPNKVFEYLAMGLPLILSDFPAWRQMLAGLDCALFVDPADPESIAAAMRELIDDPQRARRMGTSGREAVDTRFNWDTQLDVLVDAYRRIGVPG
jgi:glycosyltransferase involved in cell wall biosynthesis